MPSVRTWYKTKGCCASECVTIIIKTLFTWDYWIFRFRNAILETVHAFCCFCGRGGLFYGASFVICLQGCCCKVRVIYSGEKKKKNRFSCLPGFIFTNFGDVQIDVGLQPYLPGSSSCTNLLACQHSPSLSSFPHPSAVTLRPVMLFSVFDCPPCKLPDSRCSRILSGHVSLPHLASL